MGACNNSDGYQYSKNKAKFEGQAKANSWAFHKAIKAKKQAKVVAKTAERVASMKVPRGTARALRHMSKSSLAT